VSTSITPIHVPKLEYHSPARHSSWCWRTKSRGCTRWDFHYNMGGELTVCWTLGSILGPVRLWTIFGCVWAGSPPGRLHVTDQHRPSWTTSRNGKRSSSGPTQRGRIGLRAGVSAVDPHMRKNRITTTSAGLPERPCRRSGRL
jgi:hypothetical protein